MIRNTTVFISIRDGSDRHLVVDGALDLWRELLATMMRPAEPTRAQLPDTAKNTQEIAHATGASRN